MTETIDELRAAAREYKVTRARVNIEMGEAARRGELCTNDQMPSWPAYLKAEERWHALLSAFIEGA